MKTQTKKPSRHQKKWITVSHRMQDGYRYQLSAPVGRNFDPDFKPDLTPAEMLALGVFCGKYMTDTRKEFPSSWFKNAKLSPTARDCSVNYFGVNASRPLAEWRAKGWIYPDDPRGWGAAFPRRTGDRSNAGRHFVATSIKPKRIASQEIRFAVRVRDRRFCTWRMTVGHSKATRPIWLSCKAGERSFAIIRAEHATNVCCAM
jgi:hypothetical protein